MSISRTISGFVTKALLATSLIACFSIGEARARDPKIPTRNIGIHASTNQLEATFSYQDAFNAEFRKKLRSGLPTRIVVQINLEKKGKSKPLNYWVQSTSIVYDLWEELFIVTVEDNRGRRRAKVKTVDNAEKLAGALVRQKVAHIDREMNGTYRFRVLIETNPVSKEMVENIRRWLAKPPAGKSGSLTQTNFFGSFVGIFVDRRIGQADRSVAFVSQWFKLGGSQ